MPTLQVSASCDELVPDSEEDRRQKLKASESHPSTMTEVIEISSDSDEETFFLNKAKVSIKTSFNSSPQTPTRRGYRSRKVVESPISDHSETDVREDSDSSCEVIIVKSILLPSTSTNQDSSEGERWMKQDQDDGAILVLDEPKSARKPLHADPKRKNATAEPRTPRANQQSLSTLLPIDGGATNPMLEKIKETNTPSTIAQKGNQTPRSKAKVQVAAERERRERYAQLLFKTLNENVFDNALSPNTKLNWNKRLLTTAGRAKWHRSRDGSETTEIELAEKILDSDERIRNTLSHEMCHLATWIIDKNVKENHGRLFKAWAAKVMEKYPETTISTKHNYEIFHPFQWVCEKCSKTYGRFSKSIRPDECLCGACKEGRLVPLFGQKSKTPDIAAKGRVAATKPRDSPHTLNPRLPDKQVAKDVEDDDIESLTELLKSFTTNNR